MNHLARFSRCSTFSCDRRSLYISSRSTRKLKAVEPKIKLEDRQPLPNVPSKSPDQVLLEAFGEKEVIKSSKEPIISPVPKQPTIIDRIFNDDEIFASDNDRLGQLYPYATEHTPVAQKPTDIKGVYASFVAWYYNFNLMIGVPMIHSCKYFEVFYFPPRHFLSYGRKSRPALISMYHGGEQFNGETLAVKQTVFNRSRNPMDYAYWRNYISKRLRKALFNAFHETMDSVDGVYMIRTKKVLTDESILQDNMNQAVAKAAKMAQGSMNWVEKTTGKKINWNSFNNHLKSRHMNIFSRQESEGLKFATPIWRGTAKVP